jgi:hypothetical protein
MQHIYKIGHKTPNKDKGSIKKNTTPHKKLKNGQYVPHQNMGGWTPRNGYAVDVSYTTPGVLLMVTSQVR